MRKALAIALVVLACVALLGVGLAVVGTDEGQVPDLGYGAVSGAHHESVSFCDPRIDPGCDRGGK